MTEEMEMKHSWYSRVPFQIQSSSSVCEFAELSATSVSSLQFFQPRLQTLITLSIAKFHETKNV